MKQILCILILLLGNNYAFSQQVKDESTFELSAKPVMTIFTNYHAGLGQNNELSGFELNRAYLGYQFALTPSLSGRAIIDAAVSPSETVGISQKREVYLKNALLTWKDNHFSINGGLIGLMQFSVQENFWGHRYIAPSFQDLYKMGHSADLGITAEYRFSSSFSADITMSNGEGYKNLNTDNKNRYGLGVTINPLSRLTIRAYGDTYRQSFSNEGQRTFAFFAGYKNTYFSLGSEFNLQKNNGCKEGNDYSGVSFYTIIPLHKKWHFWGRFDKVNSTNKDNQTWSEYTGETAFIGVEYMPVKQLKIAPSYRYVRNFNTQILSYDKAHSVYCNIGFFW